eukprot:CAMPEP_0171505250 /NCGR_PEP_ID=MMETSP0958-20121227/12122_1 /TAXON_ID=87120 /ORGANISM="Aurantiochytrium limacinum, Strain ATCCMYA-1381" /LENGTH=63 /DNA_ID=CAMNT_0012041381 /DNA_START=34 /DNA_END=225 /DNA_ORIENTATION=+
MAKFIAKIMAKHSKMGLALRREDTASTHTLTYPNATATADIGGPKSLRAYGGARVCMSLCMSA